MKSKTTQARVSGTLDPIVRLLPITSASKAWLVARINAGIEADAMMRACDMYDAKRKSALYAWTAKKVRK